MTSNRVPSSPFALIRTLAALINSSARHSAIVLTDLNAESRAPKNNY